MQTLILNKSELENNYAFRIDAEYYKPSNQSLMSTLISKNECRSIGESTSLITDMGAFSLYRKEYFVENGIPFLRVDNIKENWLDLSNTQYISHEYHILLDKSKIKANDVLLTTKAIIGMSCTVPDDIKECNMSQNLVRIRFNRDIFNPYFVSTFLNCEYGKFQSNRLATGNVQLYLNFENIRNILIPIFDHKFQNTINDLIIKSINLRKYSESIYKEVERILLENVSVSNWKPKHTLSFIKNYSDTQNSERFDAEYFQPKYDQIISAIKKYKGGWDLLGNLVKIKKCIEPGSSAYEDSGISFVRVSDLSKFELAFSNTKYILESLYDSLKTHQPKKDEILLSKDATPGIAFHLRESPTKMIPSGGILRLTIKDKDRINEEYLTLVLNSLIVQQQMLRDSGGSVIYHWRPDQIKNVMIPLVDESTQKNIKTKISVSFDNRKKSKQLLEIAKRGVEIAIEKDENTAQNWIDEQLKINNLSLITKGST